MLADHVVGDEVTTVTQFGLWHKRLGYPSAEVLVQCLKYYNLSISRDSIKSLCNACELGKTHKLPFASSYTLYKKPLKLIVTDLWGPAPCFSNGKQYYISFVDAFTRHTWIYFLNKKSDALSVFLLFKK